MTDGRLTDGLPVILGCGIAGMTISEGLSRDGIEHILIGSAPSGHPRPGESLDLPASVLLPEMFPELEEHYFSKNRVVTYFGDWAVDCSLKLAPATRRLVRALGFSAPRELLHIDRIGFDAALFRRIDASAHCRRFAGMIARVEPDLESDRIRSLELDDGRRLVPGFVFDATGSAGLVAKAVGLPSQAMGNLQRGVMAHLRRSEADGPRSPEPGLLNGETSDWKTQTSFRRLYRELDGVAGGSWCIPLGDYASIGVTAEPEAVEGKTDLELLEIASRGFRQVGVDCRREFQDVHESVGLRHGYTRRERCHGSNWLLVGESFGQVWWPSSSGLGFSLAAGLLAPQVLRSPDRFGRVYSEYFDSLVDSHRRFDFFMLSDSPPSFDELQKLTPALIRANVVRLALLARLARRGTLPTLLGRVAHELVGRHQLGPVSCDIRRVDTAERVEVPSAVMGQATGAVQSALREDVSP